MLCQPKKPDSRNGKLKNSRLIFNAVLEESPPLTIPEIAHRLGWSVQMLRYRFRVLCGPCRSASGTEAIFPSAGTRDASLRSDRRTTAFDGECCAESRTNRGPFADNYADLCRAVMVRYTEYKNVQRARKRIEFHEQIHRAVTHLRPTDNLRRFNSVERSKGWNSRPNILLVSLTQPY